MPNFFNKRGIIKILFRIEKKNDTLYKKNAYTDMLHMTTISYKWVHVLDIKVRGQYTDGILYVKLSGRHFLTAREYFITIGTGDYNNIVAEHCVERRFLDDEKMVHRFIIAVEILLVYMLLCAHGIIL